MEQRLLYHGLLCFIGITYLVVPPREGSRNGHLSPKRRRARFTGYFERQKKGGSGNGAYLSTGEEPGGRASTLTPRDK
jgi:hypothetical protein